MEPGSLAVKEKLADVALVGSAGAEPIDVSGEVWSTTHENEAGLGSTLPAGSAARAAKVWLPAERPASIVGLVQLLQAPASSRHSMVDAGSLEDSVNAA